MTSITSTSTVREDIRRGGCGSGTRVRRREARRCRQRGGIICCCRAPVLTRAVCNESPRWHPLFTRERGLATKAAAKQEEQAVTATNLRREPIIATPRQDATALENRLRWPQHSRSSKPFLDRPLKNNATESHPEPLITRSRQDNATEKY